MTILDTALNANALHESHLEIRKNINFKYQVQLFTMNEFKMIAEILNNYYKNDLSPKKGAEFDLHERGKIRHIVTTLYPDRVYIHSICSNILLPGLRPYLIYDNCASLKQRGIDLQRDRLKIHLQKYYRKYKTNQGYILKGDFSKFFDNICHEEVLKSIYEKIPDIDFIRFLEKIFKIFEVDVSYMSDEEYEHCYDEVFNALEYYKNISKEKQTGQKFMRKSVDIGNEISQICGVFYPTKLDNFIKIVKGIKFYGRYMDDFYIIHPDKEYLKELLGDIKRICKELKIFLNIKKTQIIPLHKGFSFLKVRYNLSTAGKVIMKLDNKVFTRERIKLKKLAKLLDKGEITYKIIENQYLTWKGSVLRKPKNRLRKKVNNTIPQKFSKPLYVNAKSAVNEMDKLYDQLFIFPFISGFNNKDNKK